MKKTLYFFSDGVLKRKDSTLFFQDAQGNKRFLPVEDIAELMVFGEVEFNKSLVELLSQKEIILHYFNYYGYYMGSFYPREHLNSGYAILKQAQYYLDEEKRLHLAKKFVTGAANNIRQVLRYYMNREKPLEEPLTAIERLIEKVGQAVEIPALMAIEGNIRELYYRAFDSIIENKDFVFQERSRRPPKNYLNTLISFGNTLAYTVCLSEIYKTHLDPRIGYLHSTNFRRFSLHLDVAEIFKPILVDRLIFSCIAKKSITKKDFENSIEGILLKEKGKKTFVEKWEEKLKTTLQHRGLERPVSYRRLIRLELYKLEKHLMEDEEYEPFVMRW